MLVLRIHVLYSIKVPDADKRTRPDYVDRNFSMNSETLHETCVFDRLASDESIEPFRIAIPQASLDDLAERIARTRWPNELSNVGWSYGTPLPYAKELAEYWRSGYDWRKYEARLNQFPQFTAKIDGAKMHFLQVRSPEEKALPLLLVHGWPGSIAEFIDMIGPLTDPRAHGADPADAFDVVVPSLPGFGFSGPTHEAGWNRSRISKALDILMHRLGYTQYGAHGGDIGSAVCREMAVQQFEGLLGIHVLQIYAFPSGDPSELTDLSDDEKTRLEGLSAFRNRAGYAQIQSSRPQTLAYGLTDSPVAQLAWNCELFNWFGDTADVVDRDMLLTNAMLYWLTGTAGSSARFYYEDAQAGAWDKERSNLLPTAVAVFPNDFRSIYRFAKRANKNIVHWAEFDEGGHFASMEVPEVLVDDVRRFFRRFRRFAKPGDND
jgi:pimeloyl-ACP methyl ester carboxylesterase